MWSSEREGQRAFDNVVVHLTMIGLKRSASTCLACGSDLL